MLKVENINVYYGAIHALKGISVEVKEGEIVTLIGANGAGKSTILRTISGLLRAKTGDIVFEGNPIAAVPAEDIVRKGISQVPEGRRIFANMTVEENLELGAYIRSDKKGIRKDIDKDRQCSVVRIGYAADAQRLKLATEEVALQAL